MLKDLGVKGHDVCNSLSSDSADIMMIITEREREREIKTNKVKLGNLSESYMDIHCVILATSL